MRSFCYMHTTEHQVTTVKRRGSRVHAHRRVILAYLRNFIRSFVVPNFIRSFVRSLVRSFRRSFVRLFVRAFVCSFVRSFVRSFVAALAGAVNSTQLNWPRANERTKNSQQSAVSSKSGSYRIASRQRFDCGRSLCLALSVRPVPSVVVSLLVARCSLGGRVVVRMFDVCWLHLACSLWFVSIELVWFVGETARWLNGLCVCFAGLFD